MPRRHEDWERRKEYLVRPLFAEPPVLSPIPEYPEPSSFVNQPLHRSDSPLPELIVEREKRRRHDKSDKFYDKLEIKMKKFYRQIFLGEDVDIGDSISDNDSGESLTKDSGSSTEDNKLEGGKNSMDDIITTLEELNPIENAEQLLEAEVDTPLVRSDKNNENTPVSFLHSSGKQRNSDINVDSDFHANTSQQYASTDEVHSQTFTEQLDENNICDDDLETSLSNERTASESSNNSKEKNYIFIEQAIVHATQESEPDIMRKQRPSSLGELLHSSDGDNTPKHLGQDLNIAHLTMEQMSDSTSSINSPTSMVHSITQATLPMRLDSPILGLKRPSNDLYHKSIKKRKVRDEISSISDKNDIIYQNVSIEHNMSTKKDPSLFSRDVEVQVHQDMNHIEIQTESVKHREVDIQTDECEEYVRCRNASTQTEQIDRRDQVHKLVDNILNIIGFT